MESYQQIIEGVKLEAVKLRIQIDSTRNPFKKRRLMKEYARLIGFLALKPKQVFLCRCRHLDAYITKHGIDVEVGGCECLIIVP